MSKRIGVLTGGGDTPALNATLKGIALQCEELGFELIGLMQGWAGVLKQGAYCHLASEMIDEDRGGTILQSSRTNLRASGQIGEAIENLKKLKVDALIPIGGDDTLSVGSELSNDFATTFVTKTIDNDVGSNAPEDGSVIIDMGWGVYHSIVINNSILSFMENGYDFSVVDLNGGLDCGSTGEINLNQITYNQNID